jgi:hypothetical protein
MTERNGGKNVIPLAKWFPYPQFLPIIFTAQSARQKGEPGEGLILAISR